MTFVTKLKAICRKRPDLADYCCNVRDDVKMQQQSFINTCSLDLEGRIKVLSMIKYSGNKISPDSSPTTIAETKRGRDVL